MNGQGKSSTSTVETSLGERAHYIALLLEDIMHIDKASPPLPPWNSAGGTLEGVSTFLPNINFNGRALDGKASGL